MKIHLLFLIILYISSVRSQGDTIVVDPPGTVETIPSQTETLPTTEITDGGDEQPVNDYDNGIPAVTEDQTVNRDNIIWERSLKSDDSKTEDDKKNSTHHVVVVMPGLPGLPGLPGNPGQATLQMRQSNSVDFSNCRFNASGNNVFLCNYTDDYGNITNNPFFGERTNLPENEGENERLPMEDETNHLSKNEEPKMEGSSLHKDYRKYQDTDNVYNKNSHNPYASYVRPQFRKNNVSNNNESRSLPGVGVIYGIAPGHKFPYGHLIGRKPSIFYYGTAKPADNDKGYEDGKIAEVVKVPISNDWKPTSDMEKQPTRQLHFEAVELELDENKFDFPKLSLPPINIPFFHLPPFPPFPLPSISKPGNVIVGQSGTPGQPGMPGTPGMAVFSSSTSDNLAVNRRPIVERVAQRAVIPHAVAPVIHTNALPVATVPVSPYGQYPFPPYGQIPGVMSTSYVGRPGGAVSSQATVSGIPGRIPPYGVSGINGIGGVGVPGSIGYPIGGVNPIIGPPGYPTYPGLQYPGIGQYPYYPGVMGGIGGSVPIAG